MQKTFTRLALMALVAVGGATMAQAADNCCSGGKCGTCCTTCTQCGSHCTSGTCCKK